jgi:hypothetical protein
MNIAAHGRWLEEVRPACLAGVLAHSSGLVLFYEGIQPQGTVRGESFRASMVHSPF